MEEDSFNFNVDIDDDINVTDNKVDDAATNKTKARSDLHNDSDTVYRRGQKRPKKKKQKVNYYTEELSLRSK